jgi:hypothetical protein
MPNGNERPIEDGVPPPAPQPCDTEFTTTAIGTAKSGAYMITGGGGLTGAQIVELADAVFKAAWSEAWIAAFWLCRRGECKRVAFVTYVDIGQVTTDVEIIDPPSPPRFQGSARVVAQQKITVRWKCVS